MSAERILNELDTLTLAELRRVLQRAHELEERLESWQHPPEPDSSDSRAAGGFYRQEYVKCGKAGCKCADGEGHGPYWYHYTYKKGGGHRRNYIGKQRPG